MPIKLINPMNETPVRVSTPPARLLSLHGKSIGLLDISKTGGNLFLDRLERLLRERFHVANVVRTAKPTFAKPAPPGIIEQLRGVDAVVEALADWGSCTTCSLHDTINLENLGVPAVPVATSEFQTAARAQAAALNRPDFDAVYVPHPIQDQTAQEIEARADAALLEIVARLTQS